MFGLMIGLYAIFVSSAEAQCGMPAKAITTARAAATNMRANVESGQKPGARTNSIVGPARPPVIIILPKPNIQSPVVGLWDVQFISGGEVVDEGFDQYHADGTEILNDTPPPATGNVCLGVYEATSTQSIKLRHPSWIFDSTNTVAIAKAIILESVTVDKSGNTFTGTFTIQFVDLDGNPLGPDLTGTLKGTRITAD